MRILQSLFLIALTVVSTVVLGDRPALAQATVTGSDAVRCDALKLTDLAAVPDAPTQITSAKWTEASGDEAAFCQVQGYVAPQVGFEIRLPQNWNGKYLQLGCGGHCGALAGSIGGRGNCKYGLRKGYACLVSDMGHRGIVLDGLWADKNLQAKFDWGLRSTHVASLAGKAVTKAFYDRAPSKSYFMGCSTGGRQALQEAQRFPWDFDGIAAGCAPVNLSHVYMTFAWGYQAARDKAGSLLLRERDLKLLSAGAVSHCDMDDGVKDGVIGDPLRCSFDPGTLICKAQSVQNCLSAEQVAAARKIYGGPTTSDGRRLTAGGPLPGSEYGRIPADWRDAYALGAKPGAHSQIALSGFRYLWFHPEAGPAWQVTDFDFDRDYKRLGLMQALYDSSNPDLRSFKAAGGKLLIYQNMNDISVLPRSIVDLYEPGFVKIALNGSFC